MKINVKCYEVKNGGNLKGTASIGIDDKLYIKGFRIMNGSKGLFVSFPSVKHSTNNGEYVDIVYAKREYRDKLSELILKAYNQLGDADNSDNDTI